MKTMFACKAVWLPVASVSAWGLCLLFLMASPGCDAQDPASDPPTEADFTVQVRGVPFLRFEGGTFTMGRDGVQYAEPLTSVTVKPFQLMKTEVTLGMYLECVAEGACEMPVEFPFSRCAHQLAEAGQEPAADLPMTCIRWHHIQQFVRWFGQGVRLPTETEWEFAATGGGRRHFPWGANPPTCERVVRSANSFKEETSGRCGTWIEPVCSRPAGNTPDPRPLCDLLGNVGELVEDDFHPAYDCDAVVPPHDRHPCPAGSRLPTEGSAWVENPRLETRVWRGGSRSLEDTRYRTVFPNDGDSDTTGFRLARDDAASP